MIVDEVLNDDDDDAAACLVRTNFCHGVHFLPETGKIFLFVAASEQWDARTVSEENRTASEHWEQWNSLSGNFHLLAWHFFGYHT